jgi:hypothetical protein
MKIPDFIDNLNDSLKNGTTTINGTIHPNMLFEVIAGK